VNLATRGTLSIREGRPSPQKGGDRMSDRYLNEHEPKAKATYYSFID
jgi:hypothetical protein